MCRISPHSSHLKKKSELSLQILSGLTDNTTLHYALEFITMSKQNTARSLCIHMRLWSYSRSQLALLLIFCSMGTRRLRCSDVKHSERACLAVKHRALLRWCWCPAQYSGCCQSVGAGWVLETWLRAAGSGSGPLAWVSMGASAAQLNEARRSSLPPQHVRDGPSLIHTSLPCLAGHQAPMTVASSSCR